MQSMHLENLQCLTVKLYLTNKKKTLDNMVPHKQWADPASIQSSDWRSVKPEQSLSTKLVSIFQEKIKICLLRI